MIKRAFLESSTLYLRPLEISDIGGNYLNWFYDDEVCILNSHKRFPYTEAECEEYIKHSHGSRDKIVLAVIEKQGGEHIGNVSLQDIDYINRTADFAIMMGEKRFWRKGFSLEAAKLLIEHGFANLNLNRITCGTFSENTGMVKLANSLGFKQEGVRRDAIFKNNRYYDIVEFGILKSEWKP